MKLTWLGGTALRIHIGGMILACDPDSAAQGVNKTELVSGADRVFSLKPGDGDVDPARWQPRRVPAAIEESQPDVLVHDLGHRSVLVDAVGEPPLLILGTAAAPPAAGRWKTDALVVAFDGFAATAAIMDLGPRLVALAETGMTLDVTFEALRGRLNGTQLMALELGMALEV